MSSTYCFDRFEVLPALRRLLVSPVLVGWVFTTPLA
jgi:hypothetical protein